MLIVLINNGTLLPYTSWLYRLKVLVLGISIYLVLDQYILLLQYRTPANRKNITITKQKQNKKFHKAQ